MNTNEAIRTSIVGLIKQGKPSVIEIQEVGPHCRYRSPDGCKCAVGFLIPDEKYENRMDNLGAVQGLLRWYPDLLPGVNVNALVKLQLAHDNAAVFPDGLTFTQRLTFNVRSYFAGSSYLPAVEAAIAEGLKACTPST